MKPTQEAISNKIEEGIAAGIETWKEVETIQRDRILLVLIQIRDLLYREAQ